MIFNLKLYQAFILGEGTKCPLNPLSAKSDQHEISPYNINTVEIRVVMRIECMIREYGSN